MCGIVGIVRLDGQAQATQLETMCTRIHHRGPNHQGTFSEQNANFWVGLGAVRLSIIDLSQAGNQPMPNETNDIWIAYNGELYNHLELRRDLEAKGHVYRSHTDTETIIHAYEEYGLNCLNKFNGMFAFALFDRPRNRVVLARDQMGIKPVYYTWDGKTLVFASELQALLKGADISKNIDPAALSMYLSLGYVPAPHCLIAGVDKLLPGASLVFENGTLQTNTFWHPRLTHDQQDTLPLEEYVAETRRVLRNAVHRQLMSDVPLGVFLSGGLDSSIVTVLAQEQHVGPLDTFSVGFENSSGQVDETSPYNQDLLHARQIAAVLKTRHHEIVVPTGEKLADNLLATIQYIDEPVWETSFTSLSAMSRLARDHGVIVVLTGDGGDELFAGYPWYVGAQRFAWYSRIPMLKTVLPLLSVAGGARPLGMKARDLHRKLGQNDVGRYRINYDIFSHEEKQNLMHADTQAALRTDPVNVHISHLLQQSNAHTLAEKFAVSDLALWVREHFNQRVDRMTMMHSIEGRVPFQDMEVVEFALRVPMPVKMRGGRGKYLLRTAFSDLLPESVLKRPKRPFSTPTQTWLRDPLRPFVENLLSEKAIGAGGLLNGKAVQQVLQRFMAGEDTAAFKVWALLNLQAWQQVALQ